MIPPKLTTMALAVVGVTAALTVRPTPHHSSKAGIHGVVSLPFHLASTPG